MIRCNCILITIQNVLEISYDLMAICLCCNRLYAIRKKLQSLMIHDVPPDFIYKVL